jgi:hypothetical protein
MGNPAAMRAIPLLALREVEALSCHRAVHIMRFEWREKREAGQEDRRLEEAGGF